jgi:hypothetical protein
MNGGEESCQTAVAHLEPQLQTEQGFAAATEALTNLIRDRYTSASPSDRAAVRLVLHHLSQLLRSIVVFLASFSNPFSNSSFPFPMMLSELIPVACEIRVADQLSECPLILCVCVCVFSFPCNSARLLLLLLQVCCISYLMSVIFRRRKLHGSCLCASITDSILDLQSSRNF